MSLLVIRVRCVKVDLQFRRCLPPVSLRPVSGGSGLRVFTRTA